MTRRGAPAYSSRSPDVVIVGGGAIGVCVALDLAERGAKVTLLERGPELAWGCSAGNAGLICPSHAAPLANPADLRNGLRYLLRRDRPLRLRLRPSVVPWLLRFVASSTPARSRRSTQVMRKLASASLKLHRDLADRGLDTGLENRGTLHVYENEAVWRAGRGDALAATQAGLAAELIEPATARRIEPALAHGPVGAIYYPDDAHCDPFRFVSAVGDAAAVAGASIRPRVEAFALLPSRNRVEGVATSVGEIRAGSVVVAAGAWSPLLTRTVGVRLPVLGGKGYHVDLAIEESDPRVPVYLQGARVIVTPLRDRLRISGTLELGGLDLLVDRRRLAAVARAGRRSISGLDDRREIGIWRGLRPCSPDGLPIVGPAPGIPNLVLATGHGMMGLTLAPVTGRLVGDLVACQAPRYDPAPLAPGRFKVAGGRAAADGP